MCLLLLAYRSHPDYPLIVAANRDEFHSRPTAPAQWWSDYPKVLGGRDLVGGGSWLGVTSSGRFAAITNFRDPNSLSPERPSRGLLISDFLINSVSPVDYLVDLTQRGGDYNGFNLLLADRDGLWGYSNREGEIRGMAPDFFGVSNGPFDSSWPKVIRGRERLRAIVGGDNTIEIEELFDLLSDRRQAEDDQLPQTGIDLELERLLSPSFIVSPDYGTRSSTVVLLKEDGTLRFIERTFDPQGVKSGEVDFTHSAT
jgi:uncharacterized protein with NRDE domain